MLLLLAHEAVQTLWLGEPWSWSGEGCSWASPGQNQNNWIPKVSLLNPCKVTFPPWFNKQVYLSTRSQSFLSLLREELMSREVNFIWKNYLMKHHFWTFVLKMCSFATTSEHNIMFWCVRLHTLHKTSSSAISKKPELWKSVLNSEPRGKTRNIRAVKISMYAWCCQEMT